MYLIFVHGMVHVACCEKPSLYAMEQACMVFEEKPRMLKDRYGLLTATCYSREQLDDLIRRMHDKI